MLVISVTIKILNNKNVSCHFIIKVYMASVINICDVLVHYKKSTTEGVVKLQLATQISKEPGLHMTACHH